MLKLGVYNLLNMKISKQYTSLKVLKVCLNLLFQFNLQTPSNKMKDFVKTISNWNLLLKKSTDFDLWGQLVEAEMEYKMSVYQQF